MHRKEDLPLLIINTELAQSTCTECPAFCSDIPGNKNLRKSHQNRTHRDNPPPARTQKFWEHPRGGHNPESDPSCAKAKTKHQNKKELQISKINKSMSNSGASPENKTITKCQFCSHAKIKINLKSYSKQPHSWKKATKPIIRIRQQRSLITDLPERWTQ